MWMNKPLNRIQKQILYNNLEANPNVDDAYPKTEKHRMFWRKLEEELNNAGPPIKSVVEWKKVWKDQKRYLMRKSALQRVVLDDGNISSSTENTSFDSVEFKAENVILENLQFNKAASASAIKNEVQVQQPNEEFVPKITSVFANYAPNVGLAYNDAAQGEHEQKLSEEFGDNNDIPKEPCSIKLENAVVELTILQKELLNDTKQINQTLFEICDEIKRHNLEMENIQRAKLDFKMKASRKMVQLEEIKLMKSKRYRNKY